MVSVLTTVLSAFLKKSFPVYLLVLIVAAGCGGRASVGPPSYNATRPKRVPLMGYTIQAGSFSMLDNAVRLTGLLRRRGVDAYYFVYRPGIYKVRFGSFRTRAQALRKAGHLRDAGLIADFYIVSPGNYAIAKRRKRGTPYLRNSIVSTAHTFIGVPYRWGGASQRNGFDCSGLTMVVYRLNGLKLPHSSSKQFRLGRHIKRIRLAKGDLVFFATSGGRRVSHVGIYAGRGRFIHAPGRGKTIRVDSLSNNYYSRRYLGARRYY